jgi:uncharacterized protein
MPAALTYPGVYIEEIPSGVHTITGVATSIAAFIGRALRGPVNEPVTINGFGDFERIFGGLWAGVSLGFAVRDFFANGGSQAIVVRLNHPEDGKPSTAKLVIDTLTLDAASPGSWGNHLRTRVDHDILPGVAADFGLAEADLFNLTVVDMATGFREQFRNVSFKPGARAVENVLANESTLIRAQANPQAARPKASDDGLTADQLKNPPFANENDPRSTGVADADKASNGTPLADNDVADPGLEATKGGLYALELADLFNLLCIPPYGANADVSQSVLDAAAAYCQKRRALLLVDPKIDWTTKDNAKAGLSQLLSAPSKNAAMFFPRLRQPNPKHNNQIEDFVPCGAVAGVFARTDTERGVWKAPAGLEASLVGVPELSVNLTDAENGELNPLGLNCLRARPAAGRVIWGSRTSVGDDRLASEWKYIPVRRLALFIEESLYRGTQWVVFEPNDEPLWAQIRLNVGAFMHDLFLRGAFEGQTPRDAYFVKCDKETTTQSDIDHGVVNIVVGFAPLKPAEFVVIKLQQMAGQIAT